MGNSRKSLRQVAPAMLPYRSMEDFISFYHRINLGPDEMIAHTFIWNVLKILKLFFP